MQFRYLLEEAADNMRTNRATTLIALITTTFAMLGMGIFLLLYLNMQSAVGSLREEIKVIVYLRDSVGPQALAELRAQFSGDPAVAGIEFISREQAVIVFRGRFPSEERLLGGLGDNPLPASFVIKIASHFRSSEAVGAFVQKLRAYPEVEEVLYNRDWVENLTATLKYLEMLGFGIGIVLAVSMVTILANTIRLTLHSRREDIAILRLIGATPVFIKTPFVLEGALLGAMGAACSLFLLRAAYGVAETKMTLQGPFWGLGKGLTFLPWRVSLSMLVLGMALGCLGSLVSLANVGDVRRR